MRRTGGLALAAGIAMLGACTSGSSHTTQSTAPISPVTTTTATSSSSAPNASTTTRAPLSTPTAADLAAVKLGLFPVVEGLSSPVAIAFRPGRGAMYVVEQSGRLQFIRTPDTHPSVALDLSANLSGGNEQGFLGATFSPDGSHLYVDYTDRNGDTNVDEYAMRGDLANPSTRRRVFFVKQPFSNHNGGEVTFGPDGMLYIGLGDGGSAGDPNGNGQNLGTPLGKILRIDPHARSGAAYSVPADNPFVGRPGALPENWMWGLRNPWRFSFDRATRDVWIGDVGQNQYEEIDFARAGAKGTNWGWSEREGLHEFKGATPAGARDPIVETDHADGNCAIVGGYVYRGRAIPALDGVYLYGDNCRPNISAIVQRGGNAIAHRDIGISVPGLTTFGEDGTGELYAAARSGTIYRFVKK